MAKTTSQNLKLGIFVITGTALLLIASYLIGARQNMFSKTFDITAVFKNANGLQNGNNVRFSGINVGTVNKIEMVNDTTIRVHMIIAERMHEHIKKDAIAMIGSDGLVGSMLINIVPGAGNAPIIEEGDELESLSKIATQDMLSTLNVTNENAALLTAELLKVAKSLTTGKGTLGKLLNDTVLAANVRQTMVNFKSASQRANNTLAELDELVSQINFEESTAGLFLTDTISAGKMRNIIDKLETSSIEIEQMTKDLNTVIGNLDNKDGLVNYVTKDTTLVHRMEQTMRNIQEGTKGFNENMEALKHNFLTRRYFKKIERKKKKEEKEEKD